MLEEELRKFNLGRKIARELIHDCMHPDEAYYPTQIHQTRIEGLGPQDFFESVGYLTVVLENIITHPKTMYKTLVKNQ